MPKAWCESPMSVLAGPPPLGAASLLVATLTAGPLQAQQLNVYHIDVDPGRTRR